MPLPVLLEVVLAIVLVQTKAGKERKGSRWCVCSILFVGGWNELPRDRMKA
jgi:hypothetical protein